MSDKKDNPGKPVPERLCDSRRETIRMEIKAEVKSIKNAIYISSTALSLIVIALSLITRG